MPLADRRGGDATETRSTCPYCGVGCGVVIEARDDRIVGVRGRSGASCQLRPALHEGQHAASHGHARRDPRRAAATAAAADDARGRTRTRELGHGARSRRRALRGHHRRARSRRGRVLHLGAAADRGLLRLQQAREGTDRHQQRRHQLASVHVERGRRLQADARGRRAAQLLRGLRSRGLVADRGFEHGIRAPHPLSPHRGRASRRRRRGPADAHDRRRPAPYGHGARGRPAPRDHGGHRRRALQRPAAPVPVGRPHRHRLHRRRTPRVGPISSAWSATTRRASWQPRAASAKRTSRPPRAGSARHAPRCRSIARASTSRRPAPRRTRHSSTCISRPGRSDVPARDRSR